MFNEIVDPSGQNDDDSYKALTALGILSAVQSLVKATFNETQVRTGISGVELCVALVPLIECTVGPQVGPEVRVYSAR